MGLVMLDIVYVMSGCAFFAIAVLYTMGCENL